MQNIRCFNIIDSSTSTIKRLFVAVICNEFLCLFNLSFSNRSNGFHIICRVNALIPIGTSFVKINTFCQLCTKNSNEFITESRKRILI